MDAKEHYYDDPYPLKHDRGNLRVYNATKPVLLMSNQEVAYNQVLGYYVADIKEK